MNEIRILYHMMRADFLERVRRSGFLVTLFVIVVITYLYLPAIDTPAWIYLNLGGARPIYNSAWIGIAVAALMSEFFPLFGFYLVKNTIKRDRRTGVGKILATTPISKPMYTLGKWLSNLAVFGAIIVVTILTSLVLQFVRAEEFAIDLWALAAPFLFLILPELAFIAALAVLFECIHWLRGGFGNLVYYFVFAAAVLLGNLQGISEPWSSVYHACATSFTRCKTARQIDIGGLPLINLPTFRYDGVDWNMEILLPRLMWIVFPILVAFAAAFFFHRFDPSKVGATPFTWIKRFVFALVTEPTQEVEPSIVEVAPTTPSLPRRTGISTTARMAGGVSSYARMFAAELRLALKEQSWRWYLVAAGILISVLFISLDIAKLVVLPLAMVWPVLFWSSLGVREVQDHTDPIVFALPFTLRRQLLMTWFVGVLIALIMTSTLIARIALAADWASVMAVLGGALFVPSLALALGCWSGTSKLFQAVYLFLWYLASVQGVIWVDYMGHFPQAVMLGIPWIFAACTVALLGAAVVGRQRQITR